jgi:hypothetical protein
MEMLLSSMELWEIVDDVEEILDKDYDLMVIKAYARRAKY